MRKIESASAKSNQVSLIKTPDNKLNHWKVLEGLII